MLPMSESNSRGGARLFRPEEGRMIAGVCTGLTAHFKVDVKLIRLVFGVLTVFYGLGVLLYLVAWAILPREGEGKSIAESLVTKLRS